jgi:DNA-binding IclR family transcriptional regulator
MPAMPPAAINTTPTPAPAAPSRAAAKSALVKPRQTGGAQSINRAAAVLRIVSAYGRLGATLKDVAAASGLNKGTAHRILRVLTDERLLEQDVATRNFRLGLELYALGTAMGTQFDIKTLAQPCMDRLWKSTRETVYLGIRSGYDALCIDMREGSYPEKTLRLHTYDLWPLGVGSFAMALLAYLPEWEIAAIIKGNAPRLKRHPEYASGNLMEKVQETRERGFAMDATSGYPGMCGIGIPVLDAYERPLASLCVVGGVARLDERKRAQIAKEMWVESRKLGKLWSDAR